MSALHDIDWSLTMPIVLKVSMLLSALNSPISHNTVTIVQPANCLTKTVVVSSADFEQYFTGQTVVSADTNFVVAIGFNGDTNAPADTCPILAKNSEVWEFSHFGSCQPISAPTPSAASFGN
jgi:hypothetical protein